MVLSPDFHFLYYSHKRSARETQKKVGEAWTYVFRVDDDHELLVLGLEDYNVDFVTHSDSLCVCVLCACVLGAVSGCMRKAGNPRRCK